MVIITPEGVFHSVQRSCMQESEPRDKAIIESDLSPLLQVVAEVPGSFRRMHIKNMIAENCSICKQDHHHPYDDYIITTMLYTRVSRASSTLHSTSIGLSRETTQPCS